MLACFWGNQFIFNVKIPSQWSQLWMRLYSLDWMWRRERKRCRSLSSLLIFYYTWLYFNKQLWIPWCCSLARVEHRGRGRGGKHEFRRPTSWTCSHGPNSHYWRKWRIRSQRNTGKRGPRNNILKLRHFQFLTLIRLREWAQALCSPERTLDLFRDISPTDIVLTLAQPFFGALRSYSNANNPLANITMISLCWHWWHICPCRMRVKLLARL